MLSHRVYYGLIVLAAAKATAVYPFKYHPHITLAQEAPVESVAEIHEIARRRWREYRGPRKFSADQAVFVQNTLNNCWIDLAEYHFGAVPVKI